MTPIVTPLHVRSGYSLLRGTALPAKLIERARRLGHRRLALTDVNNLYCATTFYRLAKDAGLAPIIGAELREQDLLAVALVADEAGYEHLCRIITRIHARKSEASRSRLAGTEPGKAVTPALARDLAELHEGLHVIVEDPAFAALLLGAGVDSRRLWLGLDPATQPRSRIRRLAGCAERLSLPLVATGTSLFTDSDDYDVVRLLSAIRLGSTYEAVSPGVLPHRRAWLRGGGQLQEQLAAFPGAIGSNRRLAEQCRGYELLSRRPVFPSFAPPGGLSARAYLRRLCREGMRGRYGEIPPEAAEYRLAKELQLIDRLGFSEYFLVVWDIVQYARRRGGLPETSKRPTPPSGPPAPVAGRGSGGSSLVAYVLGITNVCPLAFDIPFERFIHEGREDLPDLDIDFCWRIRDDVIDYAFRRWGGDRVAMVSTHNTFQPRSALRETAKAFGLSDDQISRMPKSGLGDEARMEQIRQMARRITDLPHHLSVHPGGIVIARRPIDHYVPVQAAPKGVMITQYDKDGVEDIRLVKLDLLGNRCLSTVRCACDLIRRRTGKRIDAEALPPADPATIRTLRSAETVGCNQLESPAMRSLLRMMQPGSVRDVMKVLALIRPGAAGVGMKETFIRRHLGLAVVPAGLPRVDAILRDTHGVMLYEDDVILVAGAMLGSSLAEADRFRKAVQKCRSDEQRLRLSRQFLTRCRANGVEGGYAKSIWVQMAKFNAYSFCRAHAASYALLAYAGAYLKTHYPLEYWTAALNNNQSMYHPRVYLEQARRAGVKFLLPDVNRSGEEFRVDGGAVRVGLNFVARLGPVGIETILKARKRGPFEGVSDFLARTALGREEARSLILCGGFDFTDRRRPALMMELDLFFGVRRRPAWDGATLLPVRPNLPDVPGDYSPRRKRLDERRILGLSVREHVMRGFRPHLAEAVNADSRDLPRRVGRRVSIAGVLEARRTTGTRTGGTMMFLTLDDEYGLFEVTVFPGPLRKLPGIDRYGPYVVTGKVEDQYGAVTLSADGISLHKPCPPARHLPPQASNMIDHQVNQCYAVPGSLWTPKN